MGRSPSPNPSNRHGHDEERGHGGSREQFQTGFEDKEVRMAFIRKVYSILCVQLAFTMGGIAAFLFIPELKQYSRENQWLMILAIVVTVIVMLAIYCSSRVRRKFPLNFICLGLFTVAESYMMGAISARYDIDTVLIAAGLTTIMVFALTLFACQTSCDFTTCTGILCVLSVGFIAFGILNMFIHNKVLHMCYAVGGACIFGMYLVVDTQMIMGGKHEVQVHPEEYIFAVLNLYIDIIQLFMFILQIVGGSK